jgi:hypothetical protein
MTLRVIGAGLGRTGTMSLKLALEKLLGGRCYHMLEVFAHPEHVPVWHAAARAASADGEMPDWSAFLSDYVATVDWPASAFWPELARAFPDALILLSLRDSQSWWESASSTIFTQSRLADEHSLDAWTAMVKDLFAARFTESIQDREASIAAFERHNAHVLATAPRERLLQWRAADGWAPLCAALGVPEPDEPFPKINTREHWAMMHGAPASEAT